VADLRLSPRLAPPPRPRFDALADIPVRHRDETFERDRHSSCANSGRAGSGPRSNVTN